MSGRLGHRGERPHDHLSGLGADAGVVRAQLLEVDQQVRGHDPELHQVDDGRPAGEVGRRGPVGGEQTQGVGGARGRHEPEVVHCSRSIC
jgi:hypothetical protein